MPGRKYQTTYIFRYSINEQESTPEIAPNTTTAEFWQYDAKICRRWNVDPKPDISISNYSCFAGNPIFYQDVRGDSIPTYFLDKKNDLQANFQKEIPDAVQKMFNNEYGIEIGYNSETQMLYFKGDATTDNKVSQTARQKMMEMLSSAYTKKKSERKYGELFFGYSGLQNKSGIDVSLANTDHPIRLFGFLGAGHRGSVYINLDAFNNDMTVKNFDYTGLTDKSHTTRTFNMARIFEHEFFGHIIQRRFDPSNEETSAGKVEVLPNLFRREMGLPLRSNYGVNTRRGLVILFGADHKQVKEAVYNFAKIPTLPYVLKPIVNSN